jgi:hypothetical protein
MHAQDIDLAALTAVAIGMWRGIAAPARTEMGEETEGAEAPNTMSTRSRLNLHHGEPKRTCTQIEVEAKIDIHKVVGAVAII